MDWDDLRYALAIARARSVTGAARSLGVAHTTVARRLAGLEENLGIALFDRVGGECTTTASGAELVEVARAIEDKVQAFERQLAGRTAELDGEVVVATIEPLASQLAVHLLAFNRLYPRIRVSLHTGTGMADLAKREADVALRVTNSPDPSLVGTKLAMLASAVFGGRDQTLEDANWICFDDSLAGTPQGKWEASNVPAERIVLRTNSRPVFLEAIASGAGIGVLPYGVALQAGSIVPLTAPLPFTLPLWLLTHPDLQHTPRIRVLLDFLKQVFAREKALLEGRWQTLGRPR